MNNSVFHPKTHFINYISSFILFYFLQVVDSMSANETIIERDNNIGHVENITHLLTIASCSKPVLIKSLQFVIATPRK